MKLIYWKKEINQLKRNKNNNNIQINSNKNNEINKEYFISPNKNNFNLNIFTLLNNKKILSLKGHKNIIGTISYFINKKNYNEYLISGDDNKIVIIWDITNNYNIKYQIDTKYGGYIYSCLLMEFIYNKKIFKVINTNKCILYHIIEWNNQYIIVDDYFLTNHIE